MANSGAERGPGQQCPPGKKEQFIRTLLCPPTDLNGSQKEGSMSSGCVAPKICSEGTEAAELGVLNVLLQSVLIIV